MSNIPDTPGTKALKDGLINTGKYIRGYSSSIKGNWNIPNIQRQYTQFSNKDYRNLSKLTNALNEQKGLLDEIKRIKQTTKAAADAAKLSKDSKNILDTLLSKVPGGGTSLMKAANLALSLAGTSLALLSIKATEARQKEQSKINDILNRDMSKILSTVQTVNNRVQSANSKIEKLDSQVGRTNQEALSASRNATAARERADEAKKQSNDALYETRQGRAKLEAQIADARKQSNDALYETRQGRVKLEAQINEQVSRINNQISAFNNSIQKFAAETQATISNLFKGTSANAKSDNEIASLSARLIKATSDISSLDGKISSLKFAADKAQNTADEALKKAAIIPAGAPNLIEFKYDISQLKTSVDRIDDTYAQRINEINKRYEGLDNSLDNFTKQTELELARFSREAAFNEKQGQGDLALLNKRFEQGVKDLDDAWKMQSQQNITFTKALERIEQEKDALGESLKKEQAKIASSPTIDPAEIERLKRDNDQNKQNIKTITPQIGDIQTQLKEQDKVNASALSKLDQILGFLPFIPGRAADAIKPSIPTPTQIKQATGEAICESANGGCLNKSFDDNASRINQNSNQNKADILGAANAAAQIPELALLYTINSKLGDQVKGGISGFLGRFSAWSALNTAVSYLTLFATIHNAAMLSRDIAQTLGQSLANVLTLVGIKDSEGNAVDVGKLINSGIEGLIKNAIGAENYTALSETWSKANRIYQASVNILNSFQGLASTILSGLEITAGRVGKIGNALRQAGEVLESAYSWMNPQPKFNRVTQALEKLQAGASTIQQVTQAPLDIINATTELTNATTELTKALKEDDKPENKGADDQEPEKLKADKVEQKTASAGKEIAEKDLDPDD